MSIILCTHRSDRYDDFEEALNSLYAQSYNNLNIEAKLYNYVEQKRAGCCYR